MATRRESRSSAEFAARYGPWALVTGAAQGLGSAFAESLARRGLDLVLVDVQEERVSRFAQELSRETGVDTRPVALDLSERDFLDRLAKRTHDLSVGLLVCNAAMGQEGPFLDQDPDELVRATDVNCRSTLVLTHAFGRRMAERGRGGILLIASGAALQGSPGFANYAATKAYALVLGESLWYELRGHGVDVLSFVPGPTNTPGLRKSLPSLKEGVTVGPIRLPGPTAEAALGALGRAPSAARDATFSRRLTPRRRAIERMGERYRAPGVTPSER